MARGTTGWEVAGKEGARPAQADFDSEEPEPEPDDVDPEEPDDESEEPDGEAEEEEDEEDDAPSLEGLLAGREPDDRLSVR